MAKDTVVVQERSYTQYAVVVFGDLGQVIAEVNTLLSKGWNVVGGIQVTVRGNETYHYQSVAK